MVKERAFEREFIDLGIKIYKDFGFDSLTSRLIMLLYIEPEEISMDELSEKTGYSLASVSNKMKVLEGLRVVSRIKKPGTKKIFFYMEKDMLKLQKQKIEAFYEKFIEPSKKRLPEIISSAKKAKLDEVSKKKLEIIKNYSKQVESLDTGLKDFMEFIDCNLGKC